jgi:hypothetical protein
VSIDLYTVPGEEFALACAVEGMAFQYASSVVSSNEQAGLSQKAHEALVFYDFVSVVQDSYRLNELQSSIAVLLRARDRLLNNYKYWGKIRIDAEHLNAKSKYLLVLLAKLADECLKYDEGYLYHESMSAGQAAFAELQTYGFLQTDSKGCAYWTDAGIAALEAFVVLGDFPK